VDGCQAAGTVVVDRTGQDSVPHKQLGAAAPTPCTVEFGLGMTPSFNAWLSDSIAGDPGHHDLQLVRVDGKAGYQLELLDGAFAALTLPKVDRAAVSPAYLKLTLTAEALRRTPLSSLPREAAITPARGLTPASLDVLLNGTRLDATSVGPWTIQRAEPGGEQRDYMDSAGRLEVGDVPLRAPEARAATIIDPWLQPFLVQGQSSDADERSLVVGLGDGGKASRFELKFDRTGPSTGDLAPRADGTRNYSLYAEQVTIAAR
jgi:hypothetical protein